jgi:hypothetical protein
MKNLWALLVACCLSFAAATVLAQDVQTKGMIGGTVSDATGAAVPGAKIVVTGQTGERTGTTNDSGIFRIDNLEPGTYTVRVEQTGFKSAVANNVTVNVGRESTLNLKLEPGEITATVDVTATVGGIDQQSTSTGQNLNDQLFQNVPVQRQVSSLFYLSPGATDSINGGRDNPSVAGGSALDNLYIADGVNITNSAFGGIGTFSRSYGALGTGINTSFIKEVQVKTGGFEPQYGQSIGGIVNIITQSGGNEYHGSIYGFARPSAFEATRRQADDFRTNKQGQLLHEENYDVGADLAVTYRDCATSSSSSVRSIQLFDVRSFRALQGNANDIAAGNGGVVNTGLFLQRGEFARRYRTLNYAGKLDWVMNPSHQLTFSMFGDPTKTNLSSFAFLNIDNNTADSVLDYGTRNWAFRYNGSLSPTWTINSSFSQGRSSFNETGFADVNKIAIRTPIDPFAATTTQLVAASLSPRRVQTGSGTSTRRRLSISGDNTRLVSVTPINVRSTQAAASAVVLVSRFLQQTRLERRRTNLAFRISLLDNSSTFNSACVHRLQRAHLCPLFNVRGTQVPVSLQVFRGEFGPPDFDTRANYNAGYVQDTWRVNKYITALARSASGAGTPDRKSELSYGRPLRV